jgi:hypothetical protein
MVGYPEAYTTDNLQDILDANTNVPPIADDELDRLLQLARQRADARGSALDDQQTDCLIATEWDGFAQDEFGYHNDTLNQWAIGVLNMSASVGKDATLFTDTYVIQDGWLQTGDGRYSKIEEYEDDTFDGAGRGEMWIPKGAQEYIAIIKLSDELVHESPDAAEAMA